METVKIATWNIGSLPEQPENESAFLSCLAELNADILCMQEFPEDEELAARIRDAGRYSFIKTLISSESHVGQPHRMGIALFSRTRPDEILSHRLVRPCEALISFYGKREELHNKCFLAAAFGKFILVTGHGFPCVRYCSPYYEYSPEMMYNWHRFCVSGAEYEKTYTDLDRWFSEIRKRYAPKPVIFAADFNIDRQLDFLPETRNVCKDAFEGQFTRPPQYHLGPYKTDSILCPEGIRILRKENLPMMLDHHLLSVTVEI